MRIKLLSRMAGPEGNYSPGDILDIDKKKARELIDGKYAEAMDPEAVEVKPSEDGDKVEAQSKNSSSIGTDKPVRSKGAPKGNRK